MARSVEPKSFHHGLRRVADLGLHGAHRPFGLAGLDGDGFRSRGLLDAHDEEVRRLGVLRQIGDGVFLGEQGAHRGAVAGLDRGGKSPEKILNLFVGRDTRRRCDDGGHGGRRCLGCGGGGAVEEGFQIGDLADGAGNQSGRSGRGHEQERGEEMGFHGDGQ